MRPSPALRSRFVQPAAASQPSRPIRVDMLGHSLDVAAIEAAQIVSFGCFGSLGPPTIVR